MRTVSIALAVALSATPASAYNMIDGLRASCEIGANVVYRIAVEADKGAPDIIIEALVESYFSGLLEPEAMDYVVESISMVDVLSSATPTKLANAFRQGCMEDL